MEGSTSTYLFLSEASSFISGLAGMTGLQIVLLAIAVTGLTVLMFSTMRRLRRTQRENRIPHIRERYATLSNPTGAVREAEQVMLELDQLSRQLHARLDTKLACLGALIRDADRRIESLSQIIHSEPHRTPFHIVLDEQLPLESTPRGRPLPDDRHSVVYRLADEGYPPAEIARQVGKLQGEVELILALRRAQSDRVAPPAESGFAASGTDR